MSFECRCLSLRSWNEVRWTEGMRDVIDRVPAAESHLLLSTDALWMPSHFVAVKRCSLFLISFQQIFILHEYVQLILPSPPHIPPLVSVHPPSPIPSSSSIPPLFPLLLLLLPLLILVRLAFRFLQRNAFPETLAGEKKRRIAVGAGLLD